MSIAKTVTKLLKEVGGSFNEVSVGFDKESIWHDQYAIFVAEFDILGGGFYDEGPYVEVIVNEKQLAKDFKQLLQNNLPEGSTIQHHSSCNEWEICGPKYKEYYAQIQDALEDAYDKVNGHAIFEDIK